MTEFHNPYHFAPLTTKTDNKRHWNDAAPHKDKHLFFRGGHSRYAKGRHHGRVRCTLTTETPIFIGSQRQPGDEANPARVSPYELGGKPAIPATTLRGMISSIAEAASYSAMRVLDRRRAMTYRMTVGAAYSHFGIVMQRRDGSMAIKDLSDEETTRFNTRDKVELDNERISLLDLSQLSPGVLENFYYQDPGDKSRFYSEPGTGQLRGKFRVMNARGRRFPKASKHRDFFIEIPEGAGKYHDPNSDSLAATQS